MSKIVDEVNKKIADLEVELLVARLFDLTEIVVPVDQLDGVVGNIRGLLSAYLAADANVGICVNIMESCFEIMQGDGHDMTDIIALVNILKAQRGDR